MKIIVFGASGMLGHTIYLQLKKTHDVLGVVRGLRWSPELVTSIDVSETQKVEDLIQSFRPNVVINAVGVIKQVSSSKNKLNMIHLNALWPHKLCEIAAKVDAKVIHFSTDCVFSGSKGAYLEGDVADSRDTYGLSKYLGEVDYSNSLTLRTSIIGHEIRSQVSLIDWFLSQNGSCNGYTHAIFSGLPTISVAKFLNDYVLDNWFSGLYHLSADPISKFDLLGLVAKRYNKEIELVPSPELKIDRSLDSKRLRAKVGFVPKSWDLLVKEMHDFYLENKNLYKENNEIPRG